jgi:hypothetical protein
MSWDVTVQRFSREYESIGDIPDTERCVVLGSRVEVQAAISRHFAATNRADPAWGVFDAADGAVEFNLGDGDPSEGFMMHIRASAAIVQTIVAMCLAERWQALDCSTSVFLERVANPEAGLEQWIDFRNRVVDDA